MDDAARKVYESKYGRPGSSFEENAARIALGVENAKLIETLRFYADPENYRQTREDIDIDMPASVPGEYTWDAIVGTPDFIPDRGARARKALESLGLGIKP